METFGTLLSSLSYDQDGRNEYVFGGSVLWHGKALRKDQVRVIRIGIPQGGITIPPQARDVSEEKGGMIQAWADESEEGLTLYICSKSGVAAHYNSQYLFAGFTALRTIYGLENVNTASVKYMDGFFRDCHSLEDLDLSCFDTSDVSSMAGMFEGCSSLLTLDLSAMDTSRVRNMDRMFYGCSALRGLNLSRLQAGPSCSFRQMFSGCAQLRRLQFFEGSFERMEDLSGLFAGCRRLREADLSGMSFPRAENLSRMFEGCSELTGVKMPVMSGSEVRSVDSMFFECEKLEQVSLCGITVSGDMTARRMFFDCGALRQVELPDMSGAAVTDCRQMFYGCGHLKELDLSGMNLGKCSDLRGMFDGCAGLEKLDLEGTRQPFTGAPEQLDGLLQDLSSVRELRLSAYYPDERILFGEESADRTVRVIREQESALAGVTVSEDDLRDMPSPHETGYAQGVIFDLAHHLLLRKMLMNESADTAGVRGGWMQELQLPCWCRQGDFVFFTFREEETDRIVAMGRILRCEYPEITIGEMNRNQVGIRAVVGDLTALTRPVAISGLLHTRRGGSLHFRALYGDVYDEVRSRIFAWNRLNRALDDSVPVPVALRAIGPDNWAYAGMFWKSRFRNTAEYINYYVYYLLEDLLAGAQGRVVSRKELDRQKEKDVMRFLVRTGVGYLGILVTMESLDEEEISEELDAEHSFYQDEELEAVIAAKERPYFWCYRHMLIADHENLYLYDALAGSAEKLTSMDGPWSWSELATVKTRLYSVLMRYRYQRG